MPTDLRILLLILIIFPASLVAAPMTSSLAVNTELSKEGFVTLNWDAQNNATSVNLLISTDAAFTHRIYDLPLPGQNKVHLSGFEDGLYFARIVGEQLQPLSATVQFRVQHPSLNNAFLLFGIGLLLFLLLLACLLRFIRKPV